MKQKSGPIVVQLSGTDDTIENNFYYEICVIKDGRFCKDLTHSQIIFNYFQILYEQLY